MYLFREQAAHALTQSVPPAPVLFITCGLHLVPLYDVYVPHVLLNASNEDSRHPTSRSSRVKIPREARVQEAAPALQRASRVRHSDNSSHQLRGPQAQLHRPPGARYSDAPVQTAPSRP